MADACCKLVGNFPIPSELADKCIVSVSINTSTDSQLIEDCVIVGPTVVTISISGYASTTLHVGCPGKAGVQIPWIRKFDCDVPGGEVHFVPSGQGKSFIYGDIQNLAYLKNEFGTIRVISASSSSGPAAIYTDEEQREGYGLVFNGDPITIDTEDDNIYPDYFDTGAQYHLQNFSLEATPGQYPMASYSFVSFVPNA